MRILHVIPGLDMAAGGPVAALVGVAKAQANARCHVSVAAPGSTGPMVDQLTHAGATVHLVDGGTSATRLRALVQDSDVAHLFGLWEPIQHQAAVLCRELNRPYIFEPCGMLDRWALRRKWLKKQIYLMLRLKRDLNGARAIHVSTDWERDQTATLKLRAPLVVVPAGVDLSEFQNLPRKGLFRAKHPQLLDKPVIMFLGRVFPGKGLEMLIPALAKLTNRAAVLAVVGPDSGGYMAQMQALARQHQVADRVIFTGMARGQERIEALVDADLFSLPSEHENFGVAVLEAMAAGVPVVVSDQVGLCGDIESARAGEAVPLDATKLTSSLDRWLADDARRAAAGTNGRAVAFERFTWDRIAAQWADVYKQLGINPRQ